jgi:hypothetical protein
MKAILVVVFCSVLVTPLICQTPDVPSNADQNTTNKPAGWTPNSTVNVYLNTNDWGQPGSQMYQAVYCGYHQRWGSRSKCRFQFHSH